MKRAAFVVGLLLAGCAFDPTGLAPRGAGGDAGELGDGGQVLVDAQPADGARDAGAQVDAQLLDAAEVLADVAIPDAASPIDAPWEGCRLSTECPVSPQGRTQCCYHTTGRGTCTPGTPLPQFPFCLPN